MMLRLIIVISLLLFWECSVQGSSLSAKEAIFQKKTPTNDSQEYGFQTVYTAMAYIPVNHTKPLNIVAEKQKTQYFFIISKKNETILPLKTSIPKSKHHSKNLSHDSYEKRKGNYNDRYEEHSTLENSKIHNYKYPSFVHQYQKHRQLQRPMTINHDCIKCPPEKILIAPKGFDSVIVDRPKLLSCDNKAIINKAYYVETLYGPKFKFLLPEGTHKIYGRIKNKLAGNAMQTCTLRYKVIVRRCEKIFLHDKNINVNCDPGQIWGSKCTFTCQRGYLSMNTSIICSDNLQWEGEQPKCLLQSSPDRTQSCNFLHIPNNGRFSCEYPNYVKVHNFKNPPTKAPAGTICHVKCNRNYEIISDLKLYADFKCVQGKWNATVLNICQPKRMSNSYK